MVCSTGEGNSLSRPILYPLRHRVILFSPFPDSRVLVRGHRYWYTFLPLFSRIHLIPVSVAWHAVYQDSYLFRWWFGVVSHALAMASHQSWGSWRVLALQISTFWWLYPTTISSSMTLRRAQRPRKPVTIWEEKAAPSAAIDPKIPPKAARTAGKTAFGRIAIEPLSTAFKFDISRIARSQSGYLIHHWHRCTKRGYCAWCKEHAKEWVPKRRRLGRYRQWRCPQVTTTSIKDLRRLYGL